MNEEVTPHLILTRFNLAIKFACHKREDSVIPDRPWLDEQYLNQRFAIFEKYTFLSLLNQTDKNFKWIVLFHKDTPEKYKERIDILSNKMNQFEPWFLNDNECERYGMILRDYIAKKYSDAKVITTRLDNDDLVHERFIEITKAQINMDDRSKVLSFVNGLQYDIRSKQLLRYKFANNHFLSMLASAKAAYNHILLFNHAEIDSESVREGFSKLENKTDIPLWIEVITETNFSNALRWRFSTIYISYKITNEWGWVLEPKTYSKARWIGTYFQRVGLVFYYRSKGLINIMRKKMR